MKDYVTKVLQKFQHPIPRRPNMHPINGRAKIMALQKPFNSLGYLTANQRGTQAQDSKIVGTFLYYSHSVD